MISIKNVLKCVAGLISLNDILPYFNGEDIGVDDMKEIDNLVTEEINNHQNITNDLITGNLKLNSY